MEGLYHLVQEMVPMARTSASLGDSYEKRLVEIENTLNDLMARFDDIEEALDDE